MHRGRALGGYGDDFDVRIDLLGAAANPRSKPAAANRNDDVFKICDLFDHLKRDRALACLDELVVEGMHERQIVLFCIFQRKRIRLVEIIAL